MVRGTDARTTAAALPGSEDTIVALATAPGRAALATIRLSGPRAHEIARLVVGDWPTSAREAKLSAVANSRSGELLDRAVVIRYDAPHSFTGEHLVEISSHGGAVVPSTIIAALIDQGARQALPGEFTRRAVLHGKLDVIQGEAIADLIDARSRRAQSVALAQLDGGLSRRIASLRDELVGIEALIAYDIDFPEEDDGPVPAARILASSHRALSGLEELRATSPVGELVREGAVVVLAGAPNVGKSSLFNALLGQRRAIVTELPGTTRDALEAVIDAGAWALRLVDTAGLRETTDRLERMGIEVSEEYLERAAVVLACGDSEESLAAAVRRARARTESTIIAVRTKSDLAYDAEARLLPERYQLPEPSRIVAVSAETGAGLDALIEQIVDALSSSDSLAAADVPLLTRARHRLAIEEAARELVMFQSVWAAAELPAPVAATHLRSAVLALEELIGIVDVNDVLDRVFSSFCVGK